MGLRRLLRWASFSSALCGLEQNALNGMKSRWDQGAAEIRMEKGPKDRTTYSIEISHRVFFAIIIGGSYTGICVCCSVIVLVPAQFVLYA